MELDLKQIVLSLPTADESYNWQDVKFDIYLAKNFFTDQWQNQSLRNLVLKCRESFHRYGKVALEDSYDDKSLVSIVGVSYFIDERQVKEWLTIRFVPAHGEPFLSEDLQIEFINQKKLYDLIKEKLFYNADDSTKRLFTISRFCGIAPYFEDNFQSVENQNKIKFTAISFSLLCKFSLKYFSLPDKHVYITAMFHHNIFKRLAFVNHNNLQACLELPDTHETLLVHSDSLQTIFPGEVAFRHPTYFFRIRELVVWVKKMLVEDKLNNATLLSVLKTEIDWDKIDQQLIDNKLVIVKQLSALGDLLSGDEILLNSRCDRQQLRQMLRDEVPLSLLFKLAYQLDLEQRIDRFLADLKFFNNYEQ